LPVILAVVGLVNALPESPPKWSKGNNSKINSEFGMVKCSDFCPMPWSLFFAIVFLRMRTKVNNNEAYISQWMCHTSEYISKEEIPKPHQSKWCFDDLPNCEP